MVRNSNLIYSNARVKSLENTILSQDKITRMAHADSLEEGVRILYESGYAGGLMLNDINDFDELIEGEKDRYMSFFREVMVKGSGMEAFLKEADYHNAKVYAKLKYMHKEDDSEGIIMNGGNIPPETIRDSVMSDNYSALPVDMADALKTIDTYFANTKHNPRIIDTVLDKAMYKDCISLAKKGNVKTIIRYFTAKIDLVNILTLLRCKKNNVGQSILKDNYIDGGTYSYAYINSLFDESYDVIAEKMRYGEYRDVMSPALDEFVKSGSLVRMEALIDSYLMNIFKKDKSDIFSVSPILGFFIAKKTELKVVRLILVCLKNNVSKDIIKERLREFYV